MSGKRYVYFWADGLHVNVRLDEERSCILVIMAADEHGNKELVAVSDGYRESTASWREILLDLRRRGLVAGPRLATADGALGFWKALREVYPPDESSTCRSLPDSWSSWVINISLPCSRINHWAISDGVLANVISRSVGLSLSLGYLRRHAGSLAGAR